MLTDGLSKGWDECQSAAADLDRAPETKQQVALSSEQISPEVEYGYRVLHNQVPVWFFIDIQEVRLVIAFLHTTKLSIPSQRVVYQICEKLTS